MSKDPQPSLDDGAVVTRRFLVTGRVQGVYFRHSTRREAERLALAGVARNLPDGSVEVIAHGAAESVERLREWLHRGPDLARVARVEEIEQERLSRDGHAVHLSHPASFLVE